MVGARMALRPQKLLAALACLAVLAPSCTDRTPQHSELGRRLAHGEPAFYLSLTSAG